jgi:hypothetical protein
VATADDDFEMPDELIDIDTVVVVDSTGCDEDFTKASHPGMVGYIIPGRRTASGKTEMHIIIPIRWKEGGVDDS